MTAGGVCACRAHFISGFRAKRMRCCSTRRRGSMPCRFTTVKIPPVTEFSLQRRWRRVRRRAERFRFGKPGRIHRPVQMKFSAGCAGLVVERLLRGSPRYHYGRNWGLLRNEQLLAHCSKKIEKRNIIAQANFLPLCGRKIPNNLTTPHPYEIHQSDIAESPSRVYPDGRRHGRTLRRLSTFGCISRLAGGVGGKRGWSVVSSPCCGNALAGGNRPARSVR